MLTALGLVVLTMGHWLGRGERAAGAMPQQAYVWQRVWTDAVARAVRTGGPGFDRLVVLGAEVSWKGRRGQVVPVAIDYESLRQAQVSVAVALRVGPYRGMFAAEDQAGRLLCDVAKGLIQRARSGGVEPAEIQIDFDCAESKLAGYRLWVAAIKAKVAPVPVTVTALPCWLDRRAFKGLAAAADGYVLQVHSLRKPAGPDELMSLCDPAAARDAVEKAARLKMPFRVALPTYGYVVAFDPGGSFVGVSAEGPSLRWREGVQLRTVRADPVAMAGLVREWTQDRPQQLSGIVWYRLPNGDDRLNWRGATLACVMDGREPRPGLRAEVRRSQPKLHEIGLFNAGSADAPLRVVVTVSHLGGRLVACDALGGFEPSHADGAEVRFTAASGSALAPLRPGQRKAIAWLRLRDDREVQVDVSPLDS